MTHKTMPSITMLALAVPFVTAGGAFGQSFTRLDQMITQGTSRDGTRVVGYRTDGSSGAYWDVNGGYTYFGSEPGFGRAVGADAVSDDGRYIAGRTNAARQNVYGLFRFDAVTQTCQYIGALNGLSEIYAEGVSRDGNVIAGYGTNSSFVFQACYWTPSTGLRAIPGLSGPSAANGVSSDGRVIIGNANIGFGGPAAFRWTQDTGPTYLERIEPQGQSDALAVNSSGDLIAGFSTFQSGDFVFEDAILWQGDRILRRLPMLQGYQAMQASSLSDDGSIVGGIAFGRGIGDAFIWTAATGTITLRDYLESFGVVVPEDFPLSNRFSISADGQTFSSREGPGYIITIPTPSSFGIALSIGTFTSVRRRTRRVARPPSVLPGLGGAPVTGVGVMEQ